MSYSPKQRNWVRAAFALNILKEGLEEFVDDGVTSIQTSFLHDIRTTNGLANNATCNQCTIENVLPCPTPGTCSLQRGGICVFHNGPAKYPRMCPSQICDTIAKKIVNEHRYTPATFNAVNYAAPSWKNTDTTKWCFNACEIAKCFVMESGYADKSSVSELDCPGILSMVINCRCMQKMLSQKIDPPNDIFCKNRAARNSIMHSLSLEVTDDELQLYIDDMITLLNDDLKLKNHPAAEIARDKLNQVKMDIVVISSKDELELRKEALAAIAEKKSGALDELNAKIVEGLGKLSTTTQTGVDNIKQQEHNSKSSLEADFKNHADTVKDELDKCVIKVGTILTNAETNSDAKLKAVHASLQHAQLQMKTKIEKLGEAQEKTQNDVQDLDNRFCEILKDVQKYHQSVTDRQTCGVDKQRECIERLQNEAGTKGQRLEEETDAMVYDSDTINDICHRHGRKSEQLRLQCKKVSREIKSVSPLIQCVWPGYRLLEPENVVFVVFTEHREQIELPHHLQSLDIMFDIKSPSSEDKDVVTSDDVKRKGFTDTELNDLSTTLESKTDELLDKHKRLSIISACPVKSKRYGTPEAEIVNQTCIVLYVRVKGIIPLKEDQFPTEINGISTDVREGSFSFFGKSPKDYHETLKVGCQISRKESCFGTLGPFVMDKQNNVCSITSAHVLLSDCQYKWLQGVGEIDYTSDIISSYHPLPRGRTYWDALRS